jgi:hypothetical protein
MAFDMSKVVSTLGEDVIGSCGEPLGLDKAQSVRVARSLAAHFNLGGEEAIKAAAADTGLSTEVVSSMSKKLMDAGKEYVLKESGVTDAVEKAKAEAMAAVQNQAKGMFGKLFGKA